MNIWIDSKERFEEPSKMSSDDKGVPLQSSETIRLNPRFYHRWIEAVKERGGDEALLFRTERGNAAKFSQQISLLSIHGCNNPGETRSLK